MSGNNRLNKGKPVRDTKVDKVQPAEEPKHQVDVNPGNTAVLTVKLLNLINNNIVELKTMLQEALKDG